MKVALLWPPYDYTYVMPIPLGYLKGGLNPSLHDVRIFDCALKGVPGASPALRAFLEDFRPQVVGASSMSSLFSCVPPMLKMAKEMDPSVTTVLGGPHATALTDRVLSDRNLDFVFRGEAELSFPVFLNELAGSSPRFERVKGLAWRDGKGAVVKNEVEREHDLDRIAWPDYDAMDIEGYFKKGYRLYCPEKRNVPILATRGCPYRCAYCTASMMNGKLVRRHSIPYLVRLIGHLYHEKGIRWFNLVDDNFTFDVDYAKEFCRAVIQMKLKGAGFGTPNGIRMQKGDAELWRLMKETGWRSLSIAPESGSPAVLARMKKDFQLETLPAVVADIRRAGLKVQGFFVIGYPGESRGDLKLTSEIIRKAGFDFVYLTNFQPLPGAPVYDELVMKGEIEDGRLPANFSDGVRVYVPREEAGVNFPLFVLKTYMTLAVRRPLSFLGMLRYFNLHFVLVKVIRNAARALIGRHSSCD